MSGVKAGRHIGIILSTGGSVLYKHSLMLLITWKVLSKMSYWLIMWTNKVISVNKNDNSWLTIFGVITLSNNINLMLNVTYNTDPVLHRIGSIPICINRAFSVANKNDNSWLINFGVMPLTDDFHMKHNVAYNFDTIRHKALISLFIIVAWYLKFTIF